MNATTRCGEEVPPSRFCTACGHDQRLYSRLLSHTPNGRLGTFGKTATIAVALWAVVAIGPYIASVAIAAIDSGYSHDPGCALFWTLSAIVFWTPIIGTPAGLVALIVNWRTGVGILAAVGVATSIGVLAFMGITWVA